MQIEEIRIRGDPKLLGHAREPERVVPAARELSDLGTRLKELLSSEGYFKVAESVGRVGNGHRIKLAACQVVDVESGLLSRGWQLTSSYYGVSYEKIFRHADIKVQIQLNQTGELIQSTSLTFQRFLGHPRHNFQFRDLSPLVYSEALLDVKLVSGTHQHSR